MGKGWSVDGFDDLDAQIARLRPATGRAAMQRAAVTAMEPMAALARSLVRRDTGDLARSIVISTRAKGDARDAGTAAYAATLREGGSRADAVTALRDAQRGSGGGISLQVHVGPRQSRSRREGIKQIVNEFGSFKMGAHPYIRPAWDQDHAAMFERLAASIRDEVARSIARSTRRAAARG